MGLSDASWFAATVAILLGIYIGERILDIDFSVFLAKNRKKGKIKRMMEQRGDTTLQTWKLSRTMILNAGTMMDENGENLSSSAVLWNA